MANTLPAPWTIDARTVIWPAGPERMPTSLKYVTIQPVTLISVQFWKKTSPVSTQKRGERRKDQSFLTRAPSPVRPGRPANANTPHSAAPHSARPAMGAHQGSPPIPSAAINSGHSSDPVAKHAWMRFMHFVRSRACAAISALLVFSVVPLATPTNVKAASSAHGLPVRIIAP